MPSALLRVLGRILGVAFHVAKFRLGGADVLVDVALYLLGRAADRFAGDFLDFARRFFYPTLDLIFINAHELTPENTGKRPARHTGIDVTRQRFLACRIDRPSAVGE
jgi:hypothetical protein